MNWKYDSAFFQPKYFFRQLLPDQMCLDQIVSDQILLRSTAPRPTTASYSNFPVILAAKKEKKVCCLFCILGYSEHIIFHEKNHSFWLGWRIGGQSHHELIKYCSPSYVLCVSSHFWPFTIVKFVLEKLDKNLGLADPPPLGWAKFPNSSKN